MHIMYIVHGSSHPHHGIDAERGTRWKTFELFIHPITAISHHETS
jgi:hypothetical protein